MSIKITADSTCDLSDEIIEKYNIGMIPLSIVIGDQSFLDDGIEMYPEKIYDFVESGSAPRTASITYGTYSNYFTEILKEYDEIIHFTVSEKLSSCYHSASLFASEGHPVHVINTASISAGMGLLILDAVNGIKNRLTAEEIVATLNRKKRLIDGSFVIDSLDYLKRGEKCSAAEFYGANIFRIRPRVVIRNGKMRLAEKYRGKIENVYGKYLEDTLHSPDDIDPSKLFIVHSGRISDEKIQEIKDKVESIIHFNKVYITMARGAVSNHCGPKTMGLMFYRKQPV